MAYTQRKPKKKKLSKVIKLRIQKKPEEFKLNADHVDWTARFEGSVSMCKQEVETEKVQLPPNGVYIKSKRIGHYFFVVSTNPDVAELADGFGWTTGDAMPRGWVKQRDEETGLHYYYDEEANMSFWRPQIDSEYTRLSVDGKISSVQEDWSRHWSTKHKQWFYYNSNNQTPLKKRVVWADPTALVSKQDVSTLPDGWRCHLYTPVGADRKHSTLYYSNETMGVQWARPSLSSRASHHKSSMLDISLAEEPTSPAMLGNFVRVRSMRVNDCPIEELRLVDDSGVAYPLREYQAKAVADFRQAETNNIMIALDKERNCYRYRTTDKKDLQIMPSAEWMEIQQQAKHANNTKVSRHSITLELQLQASEPLNKSIRRELESGICTDLLEKMKPPTSLARSVSSLDSVAPLIHSYPSSRRHTEGSPTTPKIPLSPTLTPRPSSSSFTIKLPPIPEPPPLPPPPQPLMHLSTVTAQAMWQYVACAYRTSRLALDGKNRLVSAALSQRKVNITLTQFLGDSVIATSFEEWEQLRVWQACARCTLGLREHPLRTILQGHLAKKLLYRATRDGWDKRCFTDKCCWTGANAILVLCRSAGNKKRFGGVTQTPIEAPPGYESRWVRAPQSFLFSLDPPRIFNLKQQQSPSAVCFWGQATNDMINFGEYDLSIVVRDCSICICGWPAFTVDMPFNRLVRTRKYVTCLRPRRTTL